MTRPAGAFLRAAVAAVVLGGLGDGAAAQGVRVQDQLGRRPDAIVDLSTPEGVRLVHGQWRYRDARIVEIDFRAPGPDLKPSGPPIRTYDVEPRGGAAAVDDAGWTALDPPRLDARRGTGRLSFNWYRIAVTIPERIGAFDPTGATVVFEIVVDDYAEVWVDGKLPRVLGQRGGALVGGWNAPNRVVVGRDVRPGQRIELAVFGANGPLSEPPDNFIWIRSATLDFYAPRPALPGVGEVVRLDPALDAIVAPGTRIEQLADGFQFIEGPVWIPDGYLLFSDPNANVIYRWSPEGDVSVFRTKSGYAGIDIGAYGQPGSNGLTLDGEGRLTICEHGNRRVTRLERNGVLTVLADRYDGKRLNSPNDLVYRSDGTLCFSDPPFGLPKFHDDPRRELPVTGVFCLIDGTLRLVSDELTGPNGLAFSPDERALYVSNWDTGRKVVMRYDVDLARTPWAGRVFHDLTGAPGEEALDGLKVDTRGNVYVSGPGGVWILSPEGTHLGTIRGPELPANFAWGDTDGKTLYLTARTGLYRIRLRVPGVRPPARPS
jgi:gluconolactonase